MKTLILSTLMMIYASGAFAAGNDYMQMNYGYYTQRPYVEPCEKSGPVPANGGTCTEGSICPTGYEPKARYCWNGGLEECGIICRSTDPSFYDYL